jgi:pyrroline-5-carboxylate reductase
MKRKATVGIIGCGNMGSAIAEKTGSDFNVLVFDKDNGKTQGFTAVANLPELVNKTDVVVIAVKPQDVDVLSAEIKNNVKGKLVISIAAGIPTSHLEKSLMSARVIRAMPNLPARIGAGVICICAGKSAGAEDIDVAKQMFKNLGEISVMGEEKIDAVTAISGSGPGYLYALIAQAELTDIEQIDRFTRDRFIPALTASAVSLGFSPEQAKFLAQGTGRGSVEYLKVTKESPQKLVQSVASKGGTTEAALKVLSKSGDLGENLKKATQAAYERAKELSR